jgi:hypothetical protein
MEKTMSVLTTLGLFLLVIPAFAIVCNIIEFVWQRTPQLRWLTRMHREDRINLWILFWLCVLGFGPYLLHQLFS